MISIRSALRGSACLLLALLAACVNVDPETGKTIPRGSQRYEFSKVQKASENLRKGMSKMQVLMLLGSPAEQQDNGDLWVYLPERPGVLLPARSLKLQFKFQELREWGYHAIVLGQRF